MIKVKFYFVLFLTITLSVLKTHSQDCSEILRSGIFDFATIRNENDFASQFLNWVKSSSFSSASQFEENSFGLGLPKFMLDFGDNSGSSSTWKSDFLNHVSSNQQAKSDFNQQFKTANSNLISAWRDCIVSKTGLILYATRIPGSDEIILKIQVKRKSDNDQLGNISVTNIQVSKHLKAVSDYKNVSLSETGTKFFAFQVDEDSKFKSCYFIINTNISGYDGQFTLSEIVQTSPPTRSSSEQIDCESNDKSVISQLIDKCNSGDINSCQMLADCYQNKAAKKQANNEPNWILYASIPDGFNNIKKGWVTYREICKQNGESSQQAKDQLERIKHMAAQNKVLVQTYDK